MGKDPERGITMANNIITTKTALVDSLVFNNRFGNKKLTGDQIGAENLHNWKNLVEALHKASYDVYVLCENDEPTEEDLAALDMSKVYEALRNIYAQIGEVNGHKMYVTSKIATLCVAKSGTGNGNWYAPDMQFAMSKLSNAKKLLRDYQKTNGVNPEAIKEQEDLIESISDEIATLKDTPDMWHKTATRVKPESFRADVERSIARAIAGQKAKTWDELEAEEQKRKDDRKAKRQAKRRAEAEAKKTEAAAK